jgi:superfamily I DNA and RNA helicase
VLEVIPGSTKKQVSSKQLARALNDFDFQKAILYTGYPIIGTPEGPFAVDGLLLSRQHGVVIFDLVEGRDVGDYQARLDQAFLKLQAKLLNYTGLSKNRRFAVNISTICYAPAAFSLVPSNDTNETAPLISDPKKLVDFISRINQETDSDTYHLLVSAIQSITSIRARTRKRKTEKPDSRGAKAKVLEESISNLDSHQSSAVIQTIDGVQQIRGLAGSGKTIVLALKVAYLHAQHPDWKIIVAFNTRSLKGHLKRLITMFVLEQTGQEPDFENVHILNAWGAAGDSERAGVYYNFCLENGIPYLDFRSARYGSSNEPFNFACEKALASVNTPKEVYDAILIDEAQDLPPSFLQLCYFSLKPPKRLVYAFDELQSLNDSKGFPLPEELFGKNSDGTPRVTLREPVTPEEPNPDIILEKCYRNSRPILVTAHALGFGIYRTNGLVQMFEEPSLWEDIGYQVKEGELADGKRVRLARTSESSPLFLERHSPINDLIQMHRFANEAEQDEYLCKEILKNLSEDELNPEDIIVINSDAITTRNEVTNSRALLFEKGIKTELAGVSTKPDVFFNDDSVTFTGIYRAKGNEAPMVYIMNAQHLAAGYRLNINRNVLFTAITRSKAWVRIIGYGDKMDILVKEFEKVKQNGFELDFVYPTPEERQRLRIYYKSDKQKQDKRKIRYAMLRKTLDAFEAGEIDFKDIPADVRVRLKELLDK